MTKNTRAINLIIVATVLFALIVQSCAESISDTAGEFAPIPKATAEIAIDRRAQEAQVTATYISVLSSEIVSDTRNTHAIARRVEVSRAERRQRVAAVLTDIFLGAVLGFCAVASVIGLSVAWRSIKWARTPITRHLRDGAHILTSGMISDTRTTATWDTLTENQADQAHGRILTEQKTAIPAEIISRLADVARIRESAGWPLRVVDRKMLEKE